MTILTDLFPPRGLAGYVRSDNGPEFVIKAVRGGIAAIAPRAAYIESGSLWEHAHDAVYDAAQAAFVEGARFAGLLAADNEETYG